MSTHAAVQKRQREESAPQNVGPGKSSQATGVGLPLFMQANPAASTGVTLQRQCAGASIPGANGECATCNSGKPLQAKLAIGASDDPLEHEADRVADQVLAMPANSIVGVAPPRIQRHTGQATGEAGAAPASVDRVLASTGRPLDATLQQDMGQRFGHDFSRVRVHSGSEAEQSARDVSAHAYTVGNNVVFGEGRFAPESQAGRHLLAHELTHVVQQSGADGVSVGRSNENLGLAPNAPSHNFSGPVRYQRHILISERAQDDLMPGVIPLSSAARNPAAESILLRQPTSTKNPEKPAVKTLYELADHVWTSLLAFSARAKPELERVGKGVKVYLNRYDAAYASFTTRLSAAQKEAAAREKWADVMMGIVIGTGVGLAARTLYNATTVVGRIIYEATGEGVEAGLASALKGSSAIDFAPPAELDNNKVARGYLEKLLEAWQAFAIMQSVTLAFSPRRDELRDAARGNDSSATGGVQQPSPTKGKGGTGPKITGLADKLERLSVALKATDTTLTTFLTTLDTPLMGRDQDTVEQDIWIAWMGRGSGNAEAALRDDPIGRRLKVLGILGRVVPPGEYFSGEQLSGFARAEQARLGQVGHVGVVVIPPRPDYSGRDKRRAGVARIRKDAYAAVGRQDPGVTGGNEYVQFVWKARTYLRPGEVVMVTSTKSHGLVIESLGPSLPVSKEERKSALQVLGIKEGQYKPEVAEALWPYVWGAVNWNMKNELPPVQLSSSEEGVLVSENGKKLILFTALTDLDWMEAAFRRDRTGASRVVAIELDPQKKVEEFRAAGIVVTSRSDTYFIAGEIRAARHAVGQGK